MQQQTPENVVVSAPITRGAETTMAETQAGGGDGVRVEHPGVTRALSELRKERGAHEATLAAEAFAGAARSVNSPSWWWVSGAGSAVLPRRIQWPLRSWACQRLWMARVGQSVLETEEFLGVIRAKPVASGGASAFPWAHTADAEDAAGQLVVELNQVSGWRRGRATNISRVGSILCGC
jgi:hypothetical protein